MPLKRPQTEQLKAMFIHEHKLDLSVQLPAPFEVKKARGDFSMRELCREILALSKLNWNSADFCSGLPITIGFANNVGKILREFEGNER